MANIEHSNFKYLTGIELPHTDTAQRVDSLLGQTLSEVDAIERRKDNLDLAPSIAFVSAHEEVFEEGKSAVLEQEASPEAREWAECIAVENADTIPDNQVNEPLARNLLTCMPESLWRASRLQCIDYRHANQVAVPKFADDGSFAGLEKWVDASCFPTEGDHSSRVLVGYSTGDKILPTAIPERISKNQNAITLYQIHVFLHEFFHTVEVLRREPSERNKVRYKLGKKEFTLQQWWKAFEELSLSGQEPECVSSYAATYSGDITPQVREENYGKFTYAMAEQICETFVAYQLGIIANNSGWTSFREHGFGNAKQLAAYTRNEEVESANLKWKLMDILCRATFISDS